MTNPTGGPWRLLILDGSPDDPMWLLTTITMPSDVMPAAMDLARGRYLDWAKVTEWVSTSVAGSGHVSLTPISAMVWRVDEGDPR